MSRTFDEFLQNNEYNVPFSRPIAVSSVVGFGLVEEFRYDGTDRSFLRFLYFYFVFFVAFDKSYEQNYKKD